MGRKEMKSIISLILTVLAPIALLGLAIPMAVVFVVIKIRATFVEDNN